MAFFTLNGWPLLITGGGVGKVTTPAPPAIVISSPITGVALSATDGNMTVTVSRACTLHWRIKANSAPTDKLTEFPNTVEISAAGTYTYTNSNALDPSTLYYGGAWATDSDANETAIVANSIFTTPAVSSNVITTAVTPTAATVNDSTKIGAVVAQLSGNGVPVPTFSELTDADNKFTVTTDGTVILSAALDFAVDTSHTLGHRAANSSGNYDSNFVLTVIDTPTGGGGGITPDVTLSSVASILSQLTTWDGTGTGPRYIAVTSGSLAELVVTNKHFTAPVYVYSLDENLGAQFAGLTMVNCTNLHFKMLKVRTVGSPRTGVLMGNTNGQGDLTDCSVADCDVMYSDDPNAFTPGSQLGIAASSSGNLRVTIARNFVSGFNNNIQVNPDDADDTLVEDNIVGNTKSDMTRFSGGGNRTPIIRRNWIRGLRLLHGHPDMLQCKSAIDGLLWGNVILCMDGVTDGNFQGIYGTADAGTGQSHSGTRAEQNIIMAPSINTLVLAGVGTPYGALYNDLIRPNNIGNLGSGDDCAISTGGVIDYNVIARNTPRPVYGAHDLKLDIGNAGSGQSLSTIADYITHYVGNPTGGRHLDDTSHINAFMPSGTSSPTHWDYATPADRVGAYLRKKEIKVEGVHPGNQCIPAIAAKWRAAFDPNNLITS